MNFVLQSNISEWADIFSAILKVHNTLSNSALKNPKKVFDVNITNIASTESIGKKPFLYYEAVNKGRKAISSEGKKLVFIGKDNSLKFTNQVAGTTGFDITIKAQSEIRSNFPKIVTKNLKHWLNDQGNKLVDSGEVVKLKSFLNPRSGFKLAIKPVSGKVTIKDIGNKNISQYIKLIPSGHLSDAKLKQASTRNVNEVILSLKQKYNLERKQVISRFNTEVKKAAIIGKKNALNQAQASQFLSNLSKAGVTPESLDANVQQFFRVLMSIPNWTGLVELLIDAARDQVYIFQKYTPVRVNLKRIVDGTDEGSVSPPQAELQNSYVLVTGAELEKIIKGGL